MWKLCRHCVGFVICNTLKFLRDNLHYRQHRNLAPNAKTPPLPAFRSFLLRTALDLDKLYTSSNPRPESQSKYLYRFFNICVEWMYIQAMRQSNLRIPYLRAGILAPVLNVRDDVYRALHRDGTTRFVEGLKTATRVDIAESYIANGVDSLRLAIA